MRFVRTVSLAISTIALILTPHVYGHSGKTDANGCHTNKKTGEYHCHGAAKTSVTSVPKNSAPSNYTPSSRTYLNDFKVGFVSDVVDGDSITINGESIRIYGIDCPENGQWFSDDARSKTSSLVLNQYVSYHPKEKDKYGRTVAKVEVGGEDLAESLVGGGYCWWYEKYAPNDTTLKKLQAKAQKSGLNLWADPKPVPPWENRHDPSISQRIAVPSTLATPSTQNNEEAVQLFRTKTGAKYHRDGCRYLKSRIPITLQDAKAMGLGPCSICRPPQ